MQEVTYTVLFTRTIEEDTLEGSLSTDQQCIEQLAKEIQTGYDEGDLAGSFLVIERRPGSEDFWRRWAEAAKERQPSTEERR